MMGKTHVTVGMATALVLFQPTNFAEGLVAVAGGALGGVVADIDILDNDYKSDALIGQVLAILIAGICIFIDFSVHWYLYQSTFSQNLFLISVGVLMYIVLLIKGFGSNHRTFTHSFLAMILYSIAVWLICPIATFPYFSGYVSHLFLDLLNKKKVPLFYPKGEGICLYLFYANKTANKVFMWLGVIVTIVMVIYSIIVSL